MLGKRLRQATLKAKKRFEYWYGHHTPEYWMKGVGHEKGGRRLGSLRKTNVMCSCHMCRNPRHSHFYSGDEKLTRQERRAPKINEIWE